MFLERRFYQLIAEYLEHHYPDVEVRLFSPAADCLSGVVVLECIRPGVRYSFAVDLWVLRRTPSLDAIASHYARIALMALSHAYRSPTYGTHLHQGPHRGGPGATA